ncbi:MAG: homocysteine methyltransferase [Desulfobacterales bacterium]|nr:homocysteine methyltransferase [Desulfobacterales bacterium]
MAEQTSLMDSNQFITTIEVVPPAGADPGPLLATLESLADLPVDGFSVATNPVAKARMSAMALCALIQKQTGRQAVLHCTIRDHNIISLQGELWGALALGLRTVMAATGDFVALGDRARTTMVKDVNVYDLVEMSRNSGLFTGVVFDTHPERKDGLPQAVRRLEKKKAAGAQFAVTQPVYDRISAERLANATAHINIPMILGILPLRTPRHAIFLDEKVAGIAVPKHVRVQMEQAADPVDAGIRNARDMLGIARERFAGACIMPPFDHFEILPDILRDQQLSLP